MGGCRLSVELCPLAEGHHATCPSGALGELECCLEWDSVRSGNCHQEAACEIMPLDQNFWKTDCCFLVLLSDKNLAVWLLYKQLQYAVSRRNSFNSLSGSTLVEVVSRVVILPCLFLMLLTSLYLAELNLTLACSKLTTIDSKLQHLMMLRIIVPWGIGHLKIVVGS